MKFNCSIHTYIYKPICRYQLPLNPKCAPRTFEKASENEKHAFQKGKGKYAETFCLEPTTFSRDPRLFIWDPRLFSQDPRLFSRDPRLFTHDPRLFTHDPRLFTHDPRLFTHDPRHSTHDPRLLASPTLRLQDTLLGVLRKIATARSISVRFSSNFLQMFSSACKIW